MNKMKAGLVAAAVLASFSGAALAEGSFYSAVDIGQTTFVDACDGVGAGETCSDTDTAFRGSVGYQVNPSLGLEASYGNYGELKYSDGFVNASYTASGFQFSAVGSLPVSDVFALTGKLGIALTEGKVSASAPCAGCAISTSASNTTVAYGVGMRYNINKTVAVRAQYEDLGKIKADSTDTGDKLTMLSFGVIFGF